MDSPLLQTNDKGRSADGFWAKTVRLYKHNVGWRTLVDIAFAGLLVTAVVGGTQSYRQASGPTSSYAPAQGGASSAAAPAPVNPAAVASQGGNGASTSAHYSHVPNLSASMKQTVADARNGDAEAQYRLGRAFQLGDEVKQDAALALQWYERAAKQGHVEASYAIGRMYVLGTMVVADASYAIPYLETAAKDGHAKAQLQLGELYTKHPDIQPNAQVAEKWYAKAAEAGNTEAQFNLGEMYLYGNGVAEDPALAKKWLSGAAEGGYPQAFTQLGYYYWLGKEGQRDAVRALMYAIIGEERGDAKGQKLHEYLLSQTDASQQLEAETLARKWASDPSSALAVNKFEMATTAFEGEDYPTALVLFQELADRDHPAATRMLAQMYKEGQGVPSTPGNDERAGELYRKAAELGDAEAIANVGWDLAAGVEGPARIEEGMQMLEAAGEDFPKAWVWLGDLYLKASATDERVEKGLAAYRRAAAANDGEAALRLGKLYFHGDRVPQNRVEAANWFLKAAIRDEVEGSYYYGLTKLFGYDLKTENYQKAAYFLTDAAEADHAGAQYYLGYMREKGKGGAVDLEAAEEWYQKAAAQQYPEALFALALLYAQKGEEEKAVLHAKAAAAVGYAPAQVMMGRHYIFDASESRDMARGRDLLNLAAAQGNAEAYYALALSYLEIDGGEQDVDRGIALLEKAADLNFAEAQHKLGTLYADGDLIARDRARALSWFVIASRAGYSPSEEKLVAMSGQVTREEMNQSDQYLSEWESRHW